MVLKATLGAAFFSWFAVRNKKDERPARMEKRLPKAERRNLRVSRLLAVALFGLTSATVATPPATAIELKDWAKGLTQLCLGGSIQLTDFPQGRFTVADRIVGPARSPKLFRLEFTGDGQAELTLRKPDENCQGDILLQAKVGLVFIRGTADFVSDSQMNAITMRNAKVPEYGEWLIDDMSGLWVELLGAQTRPVWGGTVRQRGNLTLINSAVLDFSPESKSFSPESKSGLLLSSDWIELTTTVGLAGDPQHRKPFKATARAATGRPRHLSHTSQERQVRVASPKENEIAVELDPVRGEAKIFNAPFRQAAIEPSPADEAETNLGALSLRYRDWSARLRLAFRYGVAAAALEEAKMDLVAAGYPPAKATALGLPKLDSLEVEPSLGTDAIELVPSRIVGLAIEAQPLEIGGAMEVIGYGRVTIEYAKIGELSGELVFDHARFAQFSADQAEGASATARNLTISLRTSASGIDSRLAGELVEIKFGPLGWTADGQAVQEGPSTLSGELKGAAFALTANLYGGEVEFSDEPRRPREPLLSGSVAATYTTTTNHFETPKDGLLLKTGQCGSECAPSPKVPEAKDPESSPDKAPQPGRDLEGYVTCPPESRCEFALTDRTPRSVCIEHEGETGCAALTSAQVFKETSFFKGGPLHGRGTTLKSEAIDAKFEKPLSIRIGSTVIKKVEQLKAETLEGIGPGWFGNKLEAKAKGIKLSAGEISHETFPKLEGQVEEVSFGELRGSLKPIGEGYALELKVIHGASYQLDGFFETPDRLRIASPSITISDGVADDPATKWGKITMGDGTKADGGDGKQLEFKSLSLDFKAGGGSDATGRFELSDFRLSAPVELPIHEKCPPMPATITVTAQGKGTLKIERDKTSFEPDAATLTIEAPPWECRILQTIQMPVSKYIPFLLRTLREVPVTASHLFQTGHLRISTTGKYLSMRPQAEKIVGCKSGNRFEIVILDTSEWPAEVQASNPGRKNIGDGGGGIKFDDNHSQYKREIEDGLRNLKSARAIFELAGGADVFQDCN